MIAGVDFYTGWFSIAQISASRLVDCLAEGTLVAAFAALVLGVSRRFNSSTRFVLWFSVLLTMAMLPFFGAAGGAVAKSISPSATVLTKPELTLPASWAFWLFGVWSAIATFGLARVGWGLWRLHGLRKSCTEIDMASLNPELQRILSREALAGRCRPAALCVSDRVSVPMVIGFVHPAVVIPRWLIAELSPSELRQVLLHELAHLQRWDDWTNLAQKVLKALLFFHPAVWWIERQLSLEREMACDDAVLAETANPRAYAECLARLAEKSFVRRSLALAQAALGRIHQTSLRLAQILDADQPRAAKSGRKQAIAVVAGFTAICAITVSRAPRLVAFEDRPSSRTATTQLAEAHIDKAFRAADSVPALPVQLLSYRRAEHSDLGAALRPARTKLHNVRPHAPAVNLPLQAKVERPAASSVTNGATVLSATFTDAQAPITRSPARTSDLFYITDFATGSMPMTDAVFVIIESREPNAATGSLVPASYRISVWRIVVQPAAGSLNVNKIPHKET